MWSNNTEYEFYICGNHSVILTHSEMDKIMKDNYAVRVHYCSPYLYNFTKAYFFMKGYHYKF